MKKQLLTLFGVFFIGASTIAQVKDEGTPKSWSDKVPQVRSFEKMPAVDVEEQLAIDAMNKANGDKMLRFGYEHLVEMDVVHEGVSRTTPTGDRITLLGLECPEALSVNLIFDKFSLAEGALLFLYDAEKTEYIGAHTFENNSESNMLGTEIIHSDKIVVELFEPEAVVGKSELVLGTVVHGYLDVDRVMDDFMKNLNGSGACNIDVNCPQGIGWEQQRNSVARILNGGGFCTGSLVHNTSGTIIPYFLTANHCGNVAGAATFRFRWESPETGVSCATTANSVDGPTNMQVSGATIRANNSNSDFLLVELNSEPDPAWGVFYNGWDNSDAATITRTTGIHHPAGDIKKICHSEMPATKQTTNFNGDPNAQMWYVDSWTEGVTEPGSSGSPLFDQNSRVIGVLSGGAAACNGTSNNGQYDIYGRFGIAWDDEPANNNQLEHWLDPGNTGLTVIDGVDPAQPAVDFDVAAQGITFSGFTGSIFCGKTAFPSLTISNNGDETLTSATITYSYNGGGNQVINWTGSLNTGQSDDVALAIFNTDEGMNTIDVTVDNPNGETDENPNNNNASTSFLAAGDGENFDFELNLDCYGEETTWEVVDADGNVWYSGGPYTNAGTQTPIIEEWCLAPGCYDLTVYDSWGDGLNGSVEANCEIDGDMTLAKSNSGQVVAEIDETNVNFGEEITFNFCADNTAGLTDFNLENVVSIYPNPSEGIFTVEVNDISGTKTLTLQDMTGKVISTHVTEKTTVEFQQSQLSSGVYLLHIESNGAMVNKKIVVQ